MYNQLERLVVTLRYRPGWKFQLEVVGGALQFVVVTKGYDSYHTELGQNYHTSHSFTVPGSEPPEGWQRWAFDQLILVERHESMEFFQVDGVRPFKPVHSRRAASYYMLPPP